DYWKFRLVEVDGHFPSGPPSALSTDLHQAISPTMRDIHDQALSASDPTGREMPSSKRMHSKKYSSLPVYLAHRCHLPRATSQSQREILDVSCANASLTRSEEHTSELQS